MDTMAAYARGLMAQGQPQRVFDWEQAARIIRERGAQHASAGLSEDWGYTGGTIFRDGAPVAPEDTYVYLSSNWATPVLRLGIDEDEHTEVQCWRYEKDTPGWGSHTFWPESALAILRDAKA